MIRSIAFLILIIASSPIYAANIAGWKMSHPTSYPNGIYKLEETWTDWKCKYGSQGNAKLTCYRTNSILNTVDFMVLPRKGKTITTIKNGPVKSILYEGKVDCSKRRVTFNSLSLFSDYFLSGKRLLKLPYKKNGDARYYTLAWHAINEMCGKQ